MLALSPVAGQFSVSTRYLYAINFVIRSTDVIEHRVIFSLNFCCFKPFLNLKARKRFYIYHPFLRLFLIKKITTMKVIKVDSFITAREKLLRRAHVNMSQSQGI